jgi:hypothetical protein
MHLTIDPALAPAAAAAFTSEILPRVRAAPGFVAGYWVDPVDRQGFGFLLFETQVQVSRSNTASNHVVSTRGDDHADGCSTRGSRDTLISGDTRCARNPHGDDVGEGQLQPF